MRKILKLVSVLSLIGWVITALFAVSTWNAKVDAPIRSASEAGHIGEMKYYLSMAVDNAAELASWHQVGNPEFIRWIAVIGNARDSAKVATGSPNRVMAVVEEVHRINEYEMPPFGVSLPGPPWLFWGWGIFSLLVFAVSTLAGLLKAQQVYGPPSTPRHVSW